MPFSLEDLWKNASDEEVVAAVGQWDSTNEAAQRALAAEVRRRGLNVRIPEITAAAPVTASTPASTPKEAWFAAGAVLAVIGVLAVFLG